VRNQSFFMGLDTGMVRLVRPLQRLAHGLRRNSRSGSRRNITAHYDLGNDFFSVFLDPTMMYSCAYFERHDSTLEEASRAKNDRICRKLGLGPQDHLLEIGTGWGGFAIHAAGNYGCRVTTTTISPSQHALAESRVREAGLADRITLLLEDYRDLDGLYDKIVSIEMIEAVGYKFYDAFFRKCASLLKPAGVMALQAITANDQGYRASLRDTDFIKRYIFPGGQLPSITAICQSITAATDLRLYHLEDITEHYATTLLHWRKNFLAGLDRVREMDYSERFIRMWDFYLSLCAGSFAERGSGDVQMLLVKPEFRPRSDGMPAFTPH
jgi:cyclopropane-fatty-acyl-phospholipid synthase